MITCPYCNADAELVSGDVIYPRWPHFHLQRFWLCRPCWAYVGCHKGGNKPLGRLANAELRALKQEVHAVFDPLWRSGRKSRRQAYKELAEALGIDRDQCHVGFFDVDTCRRAIEVLKSVH